MPTVDGHDQLAHFVLVVPGHPAAGATGGPGSGGKKHVSRTHIEEELRRWISGGLGNTLFWNLLGKAGEVGC